MRRMRCDTQKMRFFLILLLQIVVFINTTTTSNSSIFTISINKE